MLFIAVFISSYVLFAFVGESYNPFKSPTGHVNRIRWRLGRYASVIHFCSAGVAVAIGSIWLLNVVPMLLIYAVLSLIGYGVLSIVNRINQTRAPSAEQRMGPASESDQSQRQSSQPIPQVNEREEETSSPDIPL